MTEGTIKLEPLTLNDLALVNFYNDYHMTGAIQSWRNSAKIFNAESCARQVWVGSPRDFNDFPFPRDFQPTTSPRARLNYLTGVEAYKFMVSLSSGNSSPKANECNISGQIQNSWTDFETAHPAEAAAMSTMMQWIRADARMVRANTTDTMRVQRAEMAARYLSGQAKGDQVLVIGHTKKDNNGIWQPSLLVESLFKALANNRSGRVSHITVMHPHPQAAMALENMATQLRTTRFVSADVTIRRAPFNELAKEIEAHKRVYTDIPQGADPQTDAEMILTWLGRANRTNTFTHLRGDSNNKGAEHADWKCLEMDNYFSPDAIRDEMNKIGRENQQKQKLAETLTDYCAKARARGEAPSFFKFEKFNKIDAPRAKAA